MHDYIELLMKNKNNNMDEEKEILSRALMNLVGYTVKTNSSIGFDYDTFTLFKSINKFQRDNRLSVTGNIDEKTYSKILSHIKVTKIENKQHLPKTGKGGRIYFTPTYYSLSNSYNFYIYIDDKYVEFDEESYESISEFGRYTDFCRCDKITYDLNTKLVILTFCENSGHRFSLYIHISKLDKFNNYVNFKGVELTQYEYDLLNSEGGIKNGTIYYITDGTIDTIDTIDTDCGPSYTNNIVDSIKDYLDEKFEKMINSKRPLFCSQCGAPAKDRECKYCGSILWQE